MCLFYFLTRKPKDFHTKYFETSNSRFSIKNVDLRTWNNLVKCSFSCTGALLVSTFFRLRGSARLWLLEINIK